MQIVACSGHGSVVEMAHDVEEFVDIILGEDGFGALGGDTGEGRVVDAAGFDRAVFGEVVDNQVDEGDLVGAVALVVEELVERSLGCGSVETDEAADE